MKANNTTQQRTTLWGRALPKALGLTLCLSLAMLSTLPAQAQNQRERQRPEQEEVIKLDTLPSGRLQAIDWKNLELRIDGKTYAFDDQVLRVYYQDSEISLLHLQQNATVRYQLGRGSGGKVIVRIWAAGADSLIQS